MRYVLTGNNMDPFFDGLLDIRNTVFGKFPPVDVYETDDAYVLMAELAGYEEKDIDLHIDNHVLHLIGRKEKKADGRYLIRERVTPPFERAFSLPETVDEDNVRAEFENGLLTVSMAKKASVAPKKIVVSVSK